MLFDHLLFDFSDSDDGIIHPLSYKLFPGPSSTLLFTLKYLHSASSSVYLHITNIFMIHYQQPIECGTHKYSTHHLTVELR